MDALRQDLRFALRLLWRDKAYTAAATLTLAVCLGANAALFSVVHTVLLKALPFPRPDSLIAAYNSFPNAGVPRADTSVPDYVDRLRGVSAFSVQALYADRSRSVDVSDRPEQVTTLEVTPSFFTLLQVSPLLGRTFTADEGDVGQTQRIILSYGAWHDLYGGRPDAVGQDVRVNGVPFTVVGVMPASFVFANPAVWAWTPAALTAQDRSEESRLNATWHYVGRLRPGATLEQARAQIDAINAANYDRLTQFQAIFASTGFHTTAVPLHDDLVRDVKAMLYLLWGGALFVLLIGAVNVANLALVRSRVRLREMATRVALGAGRLRLVRQVVTESLALSICSALIGLLIGYAVLRLFGMLDLETLPHGGDIQFDGATVSFVFTLAAGVGVLIALIPLAFVARTDLSAVFHEDPRTSTSSRTGQSLRRVLIVAQVAITLVLLIGSGLLLSSFQRVLAVDPGFTPDHVLTAMVRMTNSRYADDQALVAFSERALAAIRRLPGVVAAGVTSDIPMGSTSYSRSPIMAEGYQPRPGESILAPDQASISPGYLEAMRIRLVRGRFFDEHDTRNARRVVIIDERLARQFWPHADPIGHRMFKPGDLAHPAAAGATTDFLTVIGVVHDIALKGVADDASSVGAYYVALAQTPVYRIVFAIRTDTDPNAAIAGVRTAIGRIDPGQPVYGIETMQQRYDKALTTRRSSLMLSIGFGAVALLLAAVGIYGVLAYVVGQRTKEIGIRIALGCTAPEIFQLILKEGLAVLAVGFAVGLLAAITLGRVLQNQLYHVRPTDPVVLLGATTLLGIVAFLACVVPAGRATRIDPIVALRRE